MISCVIEGANGKGDGSKKETRNLNSNISIHPNPIVRGDQLIIPLELIDNSELVQLVDATGKVLNTMNRHENSMSIPDAIRPGIYFVTIKKEDDVQVHKVVVSRN